MLGKGLESLIPKDRQASQNSGQASPNGGQAQPNFSAGNDDFQSNNGASPAPFMFDDIIAEGVNDYEEASNFVSVPSPAASDEFKLRPVASPKKNQPEDKQMQESIFYIEVDKISPNPDQPRREFEPESLKELAASIREFGLLTPIVVTKKNVEGPSGVEVEYELIAGERRLKASKLLGLQTIPAIVRNIRLDRERLELAIIENIQREDLNPIEMARAYARLQDEFRMTQREVASRLGKSRETVANTMRLLDLPSEIQEAISRGQLTESHGRMLLAIDDQGTQMKLFNDLLSNRLTTRELKERVSEYSNIKDVEKARKEVNPDLQVLQERLSSEFGTPVVIRDHGGTGKITISFYSQEEFTELLRKFGIRGDDNLSL